MLVHIYFLRYSCSRPEKFSRRSFAWTITTKRSRFSSYWMGTRKGTLGCFQRSRRLTKSSAPKGESKPAAGGGGHRFVMPSSQCSSSEQKQQPWHAAHARNTAQHSGQQLDRIVSQLRPSEQRVMSWWWREKTRLQRVHAPAGSCSIVHVMCPCFFFLLAYSTAYGTGSCMLFARNSQNCTVHNWYFFCVCGLAVHVCR